MKFFSRESRHVQNNGLEEMIPTKAKKCLWRNLQVALASEIRHPSLPKVSIKSEG